MPFNADASSDPYEREQNLGKYGHTWTATFPKPRRSKVPLREGICDADAHNAYARFMHFDIVALRAISYTMKVDINLHDPFNSEILSFGFRDDQSAMERPIWSMRNFNSDDRHSINASGD
jgi:hypothetical protein